MKTNHIKWKALWDNDLCFQELIRSEMMVSERKTRYSKNQEAIRVDVDKGINGHLNRITDPKTGNIPDSIRMNPDDETTSKKRAECQHPARMKAFCNAEQDNAQKTAILPENNIKLENHEDHRNVDKEPDREAILRKKEKPVAVKHTADMRLNYDSKISKRIKSEIRVKSYPILPMKIIYECGTVMGFTFSPVNGEIVNSYSNHCIPKTLGTAAIDTSCLVKPKTKISFSCCIGFIANGEEACAQLEFVLYRSWNNSTESFMGNWVYEIYSNRNETESFLFQYCNSASFQGCYNYYIRVLPVYIKNCSVSIVNCNMDVIAQSRNDSVVSWGRGFDNLYV